MNKKLADKILSYTHRTQSQLGCILVAVLGQNDPNIVPRFEGKAHVTSDGYVMCSFITRDYQYKMSAFVGSLADLELNVRGIANHAKLNPKERLQFYGAVQAWLGRAIVEKPVPPYWQAVKDGLVPSDVPNYSKARRNVR
jgi:hypothetical protein